MANCVHWLFGRGASIACNLSWVVPPYLLDLPREEKIENIKKEIIEASRHPSVDTNVYRKMLQNLSSRTNSGWRHRFGTTNWDCLLEREIHSLNLARLPPWLANSHVFHINGRVEDRGHNKFRSPFLLEDDSYLHRTPSPEANIFFNFMTCGTFFVVVGMSFECEMDRFLLASLNKAEDDLPIGNSVWLVLNPDNEVCEISSSRIASALPRAKVFINPKRFEDWIDERMVALTDIGAFST